VCMSAFLLIFGQHFTKMQKEDVLPMFITDDVCIPGITLRWKAVITSVEQL